MPKPDYKVSPIIVCSITLNPKNARIIDTVEYEDVKGTRHIVPISDFRDNLRRTLASPGVGEMLQDLRYRQLMADYHYPNGVYIFFSKEPFKLLYIGKATSRAIVDRVGAHLDLRASGFLNCFVKRLAIERMLMTGSGSIDVEMETPAFLQTLMDFHFAFIPVYDTVCAHSADYKHKVGVLEQDLIKNLSGTGKPTYNR